MDGKAFSENLDALKQQFETLAQITPTTTLTELSSLLDQLRSDFGDAQKFDSLADSAKESLGLRLSYLMQIASKYADGDPNPSGIMHKALASNFAVWAMGVIVGLLTLGLLLTIGKHWKDATRGVSACEGETPKFSLFTTAGNGTVSQAAPEIQPNNTTISTCEAVPFHVEGAAQDAEVVWGDVSTGTLNQGGVYVAPNAISGPQALRITATFKAAGGQAIKSALLILQPPGGPPETAILTMVALMGALGGCLHWISGFVIFVGNRQFLRSWIAYYLLMPIEGAGLAIVVYLLVRVGVLSPMSSGGAATANLNIVGIYGFAALTGIFSKQALQALGDVFNVLFKKVQAKDAPKASTSSSGTTQGSNS